jgi:hypothetical protein
VLFSTSLSIAIFSCAWLLSQVRNMGSGKAILADEPHELSKTVASAVDAALDGADRTAESLGCFLIRVLSSWRQSGCMAESRA